MILLDNDKEIFNQWNDVKKRTQKKVITALLVQAKTFDVKRLDRKIGTINIDDFEKLELKFKSLMKL